MDSPIKEKIEKFFSQFPLNRFEKGEIFIKPEDPLLGALYLKKGHTREYVISPLGTELTLHIFAPKSFFPMTWIISGIENRYYYEALTTVEIHKAPRGKVIQFLKDEPEILYDLTRRLLLGLDKLLLRTEFMAFNKANQRVASTLLYLSRHFGLHKEDRAKIGLKFTHRDIAAFAGVTRETASRILKKLEKKKIISYKNRFLTLISLEKLTQEARVT